MAEYLLHSPLAPFLGAILAIAVLPLRSRLSDRWVSAVLALLWAGHGLARVPERPDWHEPTAWVPMVLALVEALVLLASGVALGELPLRPQVGSRSALGSAMLVGILGAAYVQAMAHPGGGPSTWTEYPVAGVTLAILLLGRAPRSTALWAAAIPMVWALTGQLGQLGGSWPIEAQADGFLISHGLSLAAFLAGLALLTPHLDPEPERVPGDRVLGWLRSSPHVAWTVWGSGLTLAVLLLGVQLLEPGERATSVLIQLALSLAVVALTAGIAWVRLPAWSSPAFRHSAWKVSACAGRLRRWLQRGWRGPLVILAAGALAYAVLRWTGAGDVLARALLWEAPPTESGQGAAPTVLRDPLFLVILALVATGLTVNRMRRRIFVADFSVPFAKEDVGWGSALASRLRNELGSITALYRTIDEALPSKTERSMELELSVEDVAAELEGAVGQDLAVPFLGTKVPVGRMLNRFSGLWRGPRLTGTLHREGSAEKASLVLTAEISGGRKSGTWRATTADLSGLSRDGSNEREIAYALVSQLAYRIVAAVTSVGSPRWEAVSSFTEGLRAYRRVQRSRGGLHAELRRAERLFMEALQADRHFASCHYNLGIVYTRLGEAEAAEAAFREAIAADADNVAAYIGLAELYHRQGDQLRCEVYAKKVIALDPSGARAWTLRGVARVLPEIQRRHRGEGGISQTTWVEILGVFQAATALAWKDLCRQELVGHDAARREARGWVSITLNNVAECFFDQGVPALGEPFLREALQVEPREPFLQLALGKNLFKSATNPAPGVLGQPDVGSSEKRAAGDLDQLEEAKTSLFRASDDGLRFEDRILRWLLLLQIQACLHLAGRPEEGGIERAFRCFLDSIVPGERLVLADSMQAIERDQRNYTRALEELSKRVMLDLPAIAGLRRPYWRKSLIPLVQFLSALEEGCPPACLRRTPWTSISLRDRPWARAQWRIARARWELEDEGRSRPWLAAWRLEAALAALCPDHLHLRQVRRQGLDSLLAKVYLSEAARLDGGGSRAASGPSASDCLRRALAAAQQSVAYSPESPARRMILSQAHAALADYQQAEIERGSALRFGSSADLCGDARTLALLELEWQERLRSANPKERESELPKAIELFEHLLVAVESAPASAATSASSNPASDRQFMQHAAIHLALGRFCFAGSRWSEAIRHLRIARASGHELAESSVQLGNALVKIRALEDADTVYREVLNLAARKLSPGNASDDRWLAEAELRLAWLSACWRSDAKEARALLKQADARLRAMGTAAPPVLRSLVAHCRAELDLIRGNLRGAQANLRRSIAEEPSLDAYARMVETLLHRAQATRMPALLEEAGSTVAAARAWNVDSDGLAVLAELEARISAMRVSMNSAS